MAIFDALKKLFAGKKTIEKVSLDEFKRERIRIEQEESRIIKKIGEIERHKEELFRKGKEEASRRQQLIIARKIKEVDSRSKSYDQSARMLSRQLRVLNGFIHLKEHQSLIEKTAVSSLLSTMELGSLQKYIEAATVEGQFQMDKFENIMESMEYQEGVAITAEEDIDTLAIVEAMNEARAAEEISPQEATKEGMDKVDKILQKEEDEAEPA